MQLYAPYAFTMVADRSHFPENYYIRPRGQLNILFIAENLDLRKYQNRRWYCNGCRE